MDYLEQLNPPQREAVTAPPGPILVLAGPGSGKTRVLTQRIAYLIDGLGVRPANILALTFTNKAAREMKERVDRLVGFSGDLWMGTFHGTCARILRREVSRIRLKPEWVIFDSDDQVALVKQAVREFGYDEKLLRPAGVHAVISSAKNNQVSPAAMPQRTYREQAIAKIYGRYQEMLLANNAADFDDLLLLAVELFNQHPDVLQRYAQRFEHVLVDEFQDTNLIQYELTRMLASFHYNLFVVGDEDQSIYRWRGADAGNMLRFEADYPAARKILLDQNYRSIQNVLDAARAVIQRNSGRTDKRLWSERGGGDKISLYEAGDDHEEARYVVDTIQRQMLAGASGGDFAVMYRTNAQSRLLEEAFLREGMPYRLVGAQRFYGRREVKDMLAYLRLVYNPADQVSLSRVINTPPRGIGDKSLEGLHQAARKRRLSQGQLLLSLGREGNSSPYYLDFDATRANKLSDFGGLLTGWIDAREDLPLPELFDRIAAEARLQEHIDDGSEEGAERWENVKELRRLANEFKDRGLAEFLENVALVADQDTLPEQLDSPTLLTLHAAKGLEFPQVFIVGLDEGLLPHSRSINSEDPEEMAEERRLFYVGITRAKDRLYLVRAESRGGRNSYEQQYPSSFLLDVPDDLLARDGSRRTSGWGNTYQNYRRATTWDSSEPTYEDFDSGYGGRGRSWGQGRRSTGTPAWHGGRSAGSERSERSSPPPMKAPAEPKFKPAMRVRHSAYGEGMVITSRLESDGDETVDVVFEHGVGFKRLLASLANLQVIS